MVSLFPISMATPESNNGGKRRNVNKCTECVYIKTRNKMESELALG